MKTSHFRFFILTLCAITLVFSLSSAHAAAYPNAISETQRQTPAPPTDAKGSLIADMPPGSGNLTEYTLVRQPLNKSTAVPIEEPLEEPTPRPRTDTDLEPPLVLITNPPEKEFFIIQTRNEKIFYLIIDHTKVSDNVYLVTEVDEEDLLNFVESEDTPSLLPFLPQPTRIMPSEPAPITTPAAPVTPTISFLGNIHPAMIIVGLALLLLAGAGLFYWKVVKPKDKLPSEADFFADDYLEESSEQDVD